MLPGAAQDGAGKKPMIGEVCPEEFLANYLQTFVAIGDGFQPGATTVKVNSEPVSDVTVLSATKLIFTTSLSAGANNVVIGTPGGSTEPRPVPGVTLEQLSVGQLTACVTAVLKFFANLNPPEVDNNVLTPVSRLMDSVAKLAAEGKFTPSINKTDEATRKVEVGGKQGDVSLRAEGAVVPILIALMAAVSNQDQETFLKELDECLEKLKKLLIKYGKSSKN